MTQLLLMIGTRKGAFLGFADPDRKTWTLKGPIFKGVQVNDVVYAPDMGGSIIVAGKSEWWGPGIQVSTDLGETWQERPPVRFAEGRGHSVERVWIIRQGKHHGATALYAGVDPGALFVSADAGNTWEEVATLTDHESRNLWSPGAAGLMVHSLCSDPGRHERMYVGISVAGMFRTDDAGQTWVARNKGVRADFQPNKYPE